jgi:hypothetical protein
MQKLSIETTEGAGEAIKEGPDKEWLISHPWGDKRFYGSVPQCKKHLSELLGDRLVTIKTEANK